MSATSIRIHAGPSRRRQRQGALLLAGWLLASLSPTAVLLAAEPPPPDKQEKGVQSFKGRVVAVDASGRMLTVGTTRMYVPDSAKLTKNGRSVTLYDIAVSDEVHGSTRQAFDGKLEAISVTVVGGER